MRTGLSLSSSWSWLNRHTHLPPQTLQRRPQQQKLSLTQCLEKRPGASETTQLMRAVWQVCVRLSGEAPTRKHSASSSHTGAGAKPEQRRRCFQNKRRLQNFKLAAIKEVYTDFNKRIPFSPPKTNEDCVWNLPQQNRVNIHHLTVKAELDLTTSHGGCYNNVTIFWYLTKTAIQYMFWFNILIWSVTAVVFYLSGLINPLCRVDWFCIWKLTIYTSVKVAMTVKYCITSKSPVFTAYTMYFKMLL